MSEPIERSSLIENKISAEDKLMDDEEAKPATSSTKILSYEEINEAIVKLGEDVNEYFRSVDLNEIMKKEKEHRKQLITLIKAVKQESERCFDEFNKNAMGHDSSMDLAEQCIKEAQQEIAEQREKLEERKRLLKKEFKEKRKQYACKGFADWPMVVANNELGTPKQMHVTHVPLELPSQVNTKNLQTEQKRSVVNTRKSETHAKKSVMNTLKSETHAKKIVMSPGKSETHAKKSVMSPRKSETLAKKIVMSPRKSETHAKKIVMSPRKSETQAKKIVMSPRKSETQAKKSVMTPRKSETHAKKSVMTPRKSETHAEYSWGEILQRGTVSRPISKKHLPKSNIK